MEEGSVEMGKDDVSTKRGE